jgi:hypothetical protein
VSEPILAVDDPVAEAGGVHRLVAHALATELNPRDFDQRSFKEYTRSMREGGVPAALTTRDAAFGDYRTTADRPVAKTS